MQITSSFLNGLTDSLNSLTSNEQTLTTELSSGVRISALSDDPTAVGENVGIATQLHQDSSYQQAATSATSLLQVSDSALGSVVSQLNQAVTIATQGVTGTESTSEISTIVTQLSGLRDEILSLANTTYQGTYVFAGSKGTTEPFILNSGADPATVTYQGDSSSSSLNGPDGSSIQVTFPGQQIFSGTTTDVLGSMNQLISDFKNGNTAGARQLTSSLTNLIGYVGQQRASVDEAMARVSYEQTFSQEQSTQLTVQQTSLLQANVTQVATSLSSSETQHSALEDAIAALEKQGTLFDALTS